MVARPGGFSWACYSAPIGKFLQDGDGCLAAQAVFSGNTVDHILLNEAKENLGKTFQAVEGSDRVHATFLSGNMPLVGGVS